MGRTTLQASGLHDLGPIKNLYRPLLRSFRMKEMDGFEMLRKGTDMNGLLPVVGPHPDLLQLWHRHI